MADEAGGPEPELIRIESIDITPNGCPLDDALSVNVQFEAMDEFKMAYWEIKVCVTVVAANLTPPPVFFFHWMLCARVCSQFIADQTNKRKIISA